MITKVTPFLMYDRDLNEVIDFYQAVFGNDFKVIYTSKNDNGNMHVAGFQIKDQEILAYNGGPHFKFSDGASLFIGCENQADVDYYWEKLSDGGTTSQCGWLQDKFGLFWQVIPTILMDMISDPNPEKAQRATQAMLKMTKIIIADLETAFNQ